MFRPTGTLFDVNNFFQQSCEGNMFETSTPNDPTGLVDRMNRLQSTIGFPSYPQPAWRPISRLNSYMPHSTGLSHAGHSQTTGGSFYPTNSDPFRNETFRIRMSLPGYERDDIKTFVDNGRLVVLARHVQLLGNDDYVANEMKKHFFVPDNCSFEDMKTNYDGHNLFINIPLHKPRSRTASTSSYSRRSSETYRSLPRQRHDSGTSTATSDNKTETTNMSGGNGPTPSYKSSYKVVPPTSANRENSLSSTGNKTVTTNNTKGYQNKADSARTRRHPTRNETESFDYEEFFRSSFRPSIVDVSPGVKKLTMSLPLPNVSPDSINLSLRDNLLALKIDNQTTASMENNESNSEHFTKTIQLPPRTNLDGLRSRLDNGVLMIEAPYTTN